MSGTPDCGGDAAAYALGALEPQEAEAFRLHLQECAVCRDELEALGGVVQALPMATTQYQPPPGLKRSVMSAVRREQVRPERVGAGRLGLAGRGGSRRRRLRGPRELLTGLAAAGLAAAGVVAGIELSAGAAGTLITAQVTGIGGSAQLRVAGDHAELLVRHLTPPARGHVYEVWLQSGRSAPVSASVLFGVNSSGDADIGIPRRIRGVSAVMVTQEPLGGTSQPTQHPVIVARIA